MVAYYEKYLKYKTKYLDLQKNINVLDGGKSKNIDPALLGKSKKYTKSEFDKFKLKGNFKKFAKTYAYSKLYPSYRFKVTYLPAVGGKKEYYKVKITKDNKNKRTEVDVVVVNVPSSTVVNSQNSTTKVNQSNTHSVSKFPKAIVSSKDDDSSSSSSESSSDSESGSNSSSSSSVINSRKPPRDDPPYSPSYTVYNEQPKQYDYIPLELLNKQLILTYEQIYEYKINGEGFSELFPSYVFDYKMFVDGSRRYSLIISKRIVGEVYDFLPEEMLNKVLIMSDDQIARYRINHYHQSELYPSYNFEIISADPVEYARTDVPRFKLIITRK